MKWYEATQYLRYGYLRNKDSWEQARWQGNLFINANSKRKFSLDETIAFPWEKETVRKTREQVEAERREAEREAQRIQAIINAGSTAVAQE